MALTFRSLTNRNKALAIIQTTSHASHNSTVQCQTTTQWKHTFLQLHLLTFLLLFVNKRIYEQALQRYVYRTNNRFCVIQQLTASVCCAGPIIDNKPKNTTNVDNSSISSLPLNKLKDLFFYSNSNARISNYILSSTNFFFGIVITTLNFKRFMITSFRKQSQEEG